MRQSDQHYRPSFLLHHRDKEDTFLSSVIPLVLPMAQEGNINAIAEMGDLFFGIRKWDVAAAWYRKAAQRGHEDSQLRLAHMIFDGYAQMDDVLMVHWFFMFSETDSSAQFMMGECYRKGRGVPQSLELAMRWFLKGAEASNVSRRRLDACAAFYQIFPEEYPWAYSIDKGRADPQLRLGMLKRWQNLRTEELIEGLRRLTHYENCKKKEIYAEKSEAGFHWADVGIRM
jgi:TPR repeat protein